MFSSYSLMLASLLTLMLLQMYSEDGTAWQGMSHFVKRMVADMEALITAEYLAVDKPRSCPALSKIAYISKTFVAYLEALTVAVSYFA